MTPALMISPIQTAVFHQGDNLADFVVAHVPKSQWQEGSLLAITSKIISLAENRVVAHDSIDKKTLIRREADHYLGEIGHGVSLTIKHGLLLPAAGIDESNSENGDYILYPQDPYASAEKLRQDLCAKLGLKNLGVIVTDSHTSPLRHGVVGAALSFAGFDPVRNMIGEKDIFGRELKMTKINLADSLATAAVLMMGEAAERCPLAVLHNAPVSFNTRPQRADLEIPPAEDMYLPLYQHLMK